MEQNTSSYPPLQGHWPTCGFPTLFIHTARCADCAQMEMGQKVGRGILMLGSCLTAGLGWATRKSPSLGFLSSELGGSYQVCSLIGKSPGEQNKRWVPVRSRAAWTWEAAGVGQCALWPQTQSIHRDKLLWGAAAREATQPHRSLGDHEGPHSLAGLYRGKVPLRAR